ncbi:hypothetical protein F2Q69_00004730 [Brassica cretica]|uniref:Uncharacterized protein n=1 Tax=Brassica cretica TaxID=69181 RepID=A0A8S9PLN3_BRACR|nr:hypothetical protein F2Q69_00004730 [Brassica cretica]
MQDQQQKQLELILTIAKNGKLFESTDSSKKAHNEEKDKTAEEPSTSKKILYQ